ncbi:uncharacterized protein [Manis javanica]|uniref:uncharacterized protein n=1 Tax=Manis javanica TaxID=9974 RepID=UPI003C6DA2D8
MAVGDQTGDNDLKYEATSAQWVRRHTRPSAGASTLFPVLLLAFPGLTAGRDRQHSLGQLPRARCALFGNRGPTASLHFLARGHFPAKSLLWAWQLGAWARGAGCRLTFTWPFHLFVTQSSHPRSGRAGNTPPGFSCSQNSPHSAGHPLPLDPPGTRGRRAREEPSEAEARARTSAPGPAPGSCVRKGGTEGWVSHAGNRALLQRAESRKRVRERGCGRVTDPSAPTSLLSLGLRTHKADRSDADCPSRAKTRPCPRPSAPRRGRRSHRRRRQRGSDQPAAWLASRLGRAPPAPLPLPRPHVRRVCLFSYHGNLRGGRRREERRKGGGGAWLRAPAYSGLEAGEAGEREVIS